MKKGIHPDYELVEIKCACGNVIKTKTTKAKMNIEICSKCHPFFTGNQKFVDTAGRIEKYRKRYNLTSDTSK